MTVTIHTEEEQAARQSYHRSAADRRRVATFDPLGTGRACWVEQTTTGYELDGDLSLLGPRDAFAGGESIFAADDLDAVLSAGELLLARIRGKAAELAAHLDALRPASPTSPPPPPHADSEAEEEVFAC